MESLEIEGFAGFKNLKIELNKINLFIGPQASGKSVLMKLAYFFRSRMDYSIKNFLTNIQTTYNDFYALFPSSNWPKNYFHIHYSIGGYTIHLKRDGENQVLIELSKEFHEELVETKKSYQGRSEKIIDEAAGFNILDDLTEYGLGYHFYHFFIPTGRSLAGFSEIVEAIQNNPNLDPIFNKFLLLHSRAASSFEDLKYSSPLDHIPYLKELNDLIFKILNGTFEKNDSRQYLRHEDQRYVDIVQASSGQRETLPLLQILQYLHTRRHPLSLYIEEPETHLFPQAQRQVLEALILMYNAHEADMHLEISTHSPYLISVLNNMLLAGQLAQNEKVDQKALDQKHPSYLRVKKEELSAYMLKDGAAFSLWDEETGLLNAQILDEVGENIDRDFDELLNLEPYE